MVPISTCLGCASRPSMGARRSTTCGRAPRSAPARLGLRSISASPITRASSSTWIQEARAKASGHRPQRRALHAYLDRHPRCPAGGRAAGHRGASVEHLPPRRFRHHSYVSLAAKGVICGLGPKGYELALEAMADTRDGGTPWLSGKRRPQKPKRPNKKGSESMTAKDQGETPTRRAAADPRACRASERDRPDRDRDREERPQDPRRAR